MKRTLEQSIYAEQIKLLYTNMRVVFAGNCIAIVVLIIFFWDLVNKLYISTWVAVMALMLLIRYFDSRKFSSISDANEFQPEFWERHIIIGTMSSGVMWSIFFILLFTPSLPEYVLFVLCAYASMVSGANAALSARVRVFLAYLLPSSLPISFVVMFAGGPLYFIMGFGILAYTVANIVVSINFNKIIVHAIHLRFENLNLIEELQKEKLAAEKAVMAKDKFLVSASHDLRQPLHAQGLYLDAIEDNVREAGKDQLNSIRKTNEALSSLFNSLLDVSRLNSGIVEATKEPLNLKDILMPIVEEFKGHAERANLKLEVTCPKDIIVVIDQMLIKRVIRNLLSNAFRYTNKGKVAIKCSLTKKKDEVILSVIDTGIGMPENELENIFHEYHQLDNPERDREKGLGLGLAIVKKMCELMETPIECKSKVGTGSYFCMTIPISNIKIIKTIETIAPQSLSGKHILVIDDERGILEGMIKLLENWGCQVTVAESKNEALDKLRDNKKTNPLDLIIADYRLRNNKTGAEAITCIQEFLKRKISAIIITGDTSEQLLQEATQQGFYLLHKPVAPARLRSVINKTLGTAQ